MGLIYLVTLELNIWLIYAKRNELKCSLVLDNT